MANDHSPSARKFWGNERERSSCRKITPTFRTSFPLKPTGHNLCYKEFQHQVISAQFHMSVATAAAGCLPAICESEFPCLSGVILQTDHAPMHDNQFDPII